MEKKARIEQYKFRSQFLNTNFHEKEPCFLEGIADPYPGAEKGKLSNNNHLI